MKKKGFTLIELLVVISIIAVLSAIGLSTFLNSQKRARDARREADLESIRSALELYRADNPTIGYVVSGSYAGLAGPLALYISTLPLDPKPPSVYTYSGGGATYTLCATQEVLLPANYCLSPP